MRVEIGNVAKESMGAERQGSDPSCHYLKGW